MDPKANSLCEAFPLLHIAPHALLAFVNERFDSVLLDFLLGMNAQLFAHFHLHRQTVRVPTRFSLTAKTAHGTVAREKILDRASQAVTRMR